MTLSFNYTATLTQKRSKSNPMLVVFCDKDGKVLGNIDDALASRAATLIKKAGFKGGLGECVTDFGEDAALAVVGVGALNKLANNIAKTASATYQAIKDQKSATIVWGDVICQKHFGQFVVALAGSHYRFDTYKKDAKAPTLTTVTLVNNKDDAVDYEAALAFSLALITGQNLAKDVANEPPNVCTPSHMVKQAKKLAKDYPDHVNVTIIEEKEMKKLGMGCFLAVSQGSEEEGKIAVIEYFGKSKKTSKAKLSNPIALVGKGITFDTGGISLKPAAGMDEMKFDMGGAAAMLGVAKGLCESGLALDVVIVLALAENMPSGSASRPGDVVYAMDGTSVEIMNTDAEGRLVLADALCYTQENYKPSVIIDAATLTGACVVALGAHRSGLYSNDEDTLFALETASEASGDLVWHMPLGDDYHAQIKSPVADLQNIGGPKGGSITAACFLEHFIKEDQAWVHLDIAGTAWVGGDKKGATGRPVPLIMHYLKAKAA
ncbi:MAG: leucyl aminopeptidase [Moraxella sp.]|nr:leucyl aminopeptidase [Moraxella sp.]